jgi:hypothetical protein
VGPDDWLSAWVGTACAPALGGAAKPNISNAQPHQQIELRLETSKDIKLL